MQISSSITGYSVVFIDAMIVLLPCNTPYQEQRAEFCFPDSSLIPGSLHSHSLALLFP